MEDNEFAALLSLMMASDPWPLSDDEDRILIGLLEREAKKRGFRDWIEAYHKVPKVGERE